MNDPPSLAALARAFNRIALESFGGGLSAWSREVVVREKGWLTEREFLSASAICRVMPGANQVNLAVFVGMKLRGAPGAAAALLGLVALPTLLVLGAGALYLRWRGVPAVHVGLTGMASAAVGLTLATAWHQARAALDGAVPVLVCAATIGLAAFARAPLWLTLLLLVPIGTFWAARRTRG